MSEEPGTITNYTNLCPACGSSFWMARPVPTIATMTGDPLYEFTCRVCTRVWQESLSWAWATYTVGEQR